MSFIGLIAFVSEHKSPIGDRRLNIVDDQFRSTAEAISSEITAELSLNVVTLSKQQASFESLFWIYSTQFLSFHYLSIQ